MPETRPIECPHCKAVGDTNFFKEGFKWLCNGKVQRWRCKTCGGTFHQ